jgi:DNA-binding transcriptional regulator YdaS (Cro superfamily)
MELREYLFRREIKKGDFALMVGTSPKTIWALLKGMQDVKLSIALKIEEITKGEVSCRDLAKKSKVKAEDLMEREREPTKRGPYKRRGL